MLPNVPEPFNQGRLDNLDLSPEILKPWHQQGRTLRLKQCSSTQDKFLEKRSNDWAERRHDIPKDGSEN